MINVGLLVAYISFILLIPIAIHGSTKYRASRSSWRGIHFGYRGDRKEFLQEFIIGALITFCTMGIYYFWFIVKIRKYIFGHLRFGSISFSYNGAGTDYFRLNLKGYFLSVITLGVYFFWYVRDLFRFFVDNIQMEQDGEIVNFRSTATAGGYFKLIIGNVFIIILTLGFGTPWATVRTLNFIFSNILIEGNLDVNAIQQTEMDYRDATGEDISDMIDIGLV